MKTEINFFPEYWDNLEAMINNYYLNKPFTTEQVVCFINGTLTLDRQITENENKFEKLEALKNLYVVVSWAEEFNLMQTRTQWEKTLRENLYNAQRLNLNLPNLTKIL